MVAYERWDLFASRIGLSVQHALYVNLATINVRHVAGELHLGWLQSAIERIEHHKRFVFLGRECRQYHVRSRLVTAICIRLRGRFADGHLIRKSDKCSANFDATVSLSLVKVNRFKVTKLVSLLL